MKQVKEMLPNNIYMLKGACSSNSTFFENEKEARLFMNYINKYLKDYVEVNCYQNGKDGWILIITVKTEAEIKEAYRKRRENSKKCKAECAFDEVWRILSDQIRIALSCYVKTTNALNEREGGKVKSSYKRYCFDSVEEAIAVMQKMDLQEIDQSQPKKRYQGVKELFNVGKKVLKKSIYFCCAQIRTGLKGAELVMGCLCLLDYLGDVLLYRVNKTFLEHKFKMSF